MVFRVNGLVPLAQLRDEMDRLVTDFLGAPAAAPARWEWRAPSYPALNVWEEGDVIYAEAEVPGLKQEDLDISVVGGDLTIHGRRGGDTREGATYHRQERGAGEFNRVLRLPIEVDAAKVEATLVGGVLLIKLPKAESAKPHKIKVKTE
jgi:HSP20 family protein